MYVVDTQSHQKHLSEACLKIINEYNTNNTGICFYDPDLNCSHNIRVCIFHIALKKWYPDKYFHLFLSKIIYTHCVYPK